MHRLPRPGPMPFEGEAPILPKGEHQPTALSTHASSLYRHLQEEPALIPAPATQSRPRPRPRRKPSAEVISCTPCVPCIAEPVLSTMPPKGPSAGTDESTSSPPPSGSRQKHIPPVSLVVKDERCVHIRSDQFTTEIMRGLMNSKHYTHYEDRALAEYRHQFARSAGELIITIAPEHGANWEEVLRALNALGDEAVDTFLALIAIAIDTNGPHNITASFFINPDDVLATCYRKKSHGSYTVGQRLTVIEHLNLLSHARIQATLIAPYKKRGKAVQYRTGSAIIDILSGIIGAYETITGEELWVKRSVKIGNWAKMVPEISGQTAILLRQVLKYHSHHERYEKRLGRYLTLQFRVNAQKNGCVVRRSMAVLLEAAGITPDLKHPAKAREDIESALVRLQRDDVIGRYVPVIDSSPLAQEVQERIEQQAYHWYHWWDDYSQQVWVIEPPKHIREAYRSISQESSREA